MSRYVVRCHDRLGVDMCCGAVDPGSEITVCNRDGIALYVVRGDGHQRRDPGNIEAVL